MPRHGPAPQQVTSGQSPEAKVHGGQRAIWRIYGGLTQGRHKRRIQGGQHLENGHMADTWQTQGGHMADKNMVDTVWGRGQSGFKANIRRTRGGYKADTRRPQGGYMEDRWQARFGGGTKERWGHGGHMEARSKWTPGGYKADAWQTQGGCRQGRHKADKLRERGQNIVANLFPPKKEFHNIFFWEINRIFF